MSKPIPSFDNLLSEGLSELRGRLKERVRGGKLSQDRAKDIVPLIEDLNFPGLMMFLSKGTSGQRGAASGKLQSFDLQNSRLVEAALKRLPRSVPLRRDEIKQVIQLVQSGQFRGDVADATAAILHLVPALPISLVRDVRSLPRLPIRLVIAVKRDLTGSPGRIRSVLKDLLDNGELDQQPVILSNTVNVLFRQAAPFQVAQTIHTLLGNDTVRLAIIVYARAEGVRISQKELDSVRDALDPNDPDLGALIVPAFDRFGKEYGIPKTMDLLERLTA